MAANAEFAASRPSQSPTVAICIGTYNQAQYLRGSVESALAQTYPIQEIWIADDASTDDTPAVMEEISHVYPQIHLYRQPTNLKISGNLSWLLAKPRTELIVRLDSDDRLEPNYVEVLAELMRQYPKAGFAHCNVFEVDGNNRRRRVRRLNRSKVYECSEDFLKSNASGYRTAANCILYRAEALREVNYYIPSVGWEPCEDWDMILRITAKGWGNVYAAQILSNYRVWDDVQGARAKRKMAEVSNLTRVYEKTLIPEYRKRGWSIAPLRRNMRRKAIAFVDALDSPRFTEEDRAEYKVVLYGLGRSLSLSIVIALAEMGFSPAFRVWKRIKLRLRDAVKRILRGSPSPASAAGA